MMRRNYYAGSLWRLLVAYLSVALIVLYPLTGTVLANPTGESVVAGSAQFDRAGDALTVTQETDRAVINWESFSIGAGELTQFVQPGMDAAALNRVVGPDVSSLYGTLSANGQIYLINPHGIIVGPDGVIDVHSFVGSTLDVSNAEFLSGGELLFSGDSAAEVRNLGTIDAMGGDVFLIARKVSNEGSISAPDGTAALAGASEVLLTQSGPDPLIVQPDAEGAIVNEGAIEGARVELQAAGGNMYALAINNEGAVRATEAVRENGRVLLQASQGTVRHSGIIETEGGSVGVTGEEVVLEDGSTIDAGGEAGGVVEVGGSYQGRGPLASSQKTIVAEAAEIHADGAAGDGGRVVIWSDGETQFSGTVTAEAAGETGQGGFVEVSGLGGLAFDGTVSTLAESGLTGTLVIDPIDVFVADSGGDITPATIASAVGSNHVVVHTSGAGEADGGIWIEDPVEYDSSNSLTFLAHEQIMAGASVQNSGSGDLNLVAGWDGFTEAPGGDGPGPTTIGDVFDIVGLLSTANSYGASDGDIRVGYAGGEHQEVVVGSRAGDTTVLGYDITIEPAPSEETPALIGYLAPAEGQADAPGDITVGAARNINVFGYEGNYAQIGHGTKGADLSASGDITVWAEDGYVWISGANSGFGAFAHIGHGGLAPDEVLPGTLSGDITVVAGDEIMVEGGRDVDTFGQIGHGGKDYDDTMSGDILVGSDEVYVMGGEGDDSQAQIGHGGSGVDGTLSGHITVIGDTEVVSDVGTAHIGHGSVDGASTGDRTGHILIDTASEQGELVLLTGEGEAPWWIGHLTSGGTVSDADLAMVLGGLAVEDTGPEPGEMVSVNTEEFVDVLTQNLEGGAVTLATDGPDPDAMGVHLPLGLPPVFCSNDLSFLSAGDLDFYASVQKDGTGDVNAVAGWVGRAGLNAPADLANPTDPLFDVEAMLAVNPSPWGFGPDGSHVHIGDGSQEQGIAVGSRHGRTLVRADSVHLAGSSEDGGYAQIGFHVHSVGEEYTVTGPIDMNDLWGSCEGIAGSGNDAYVQIGHGARDANGVEPDGDLSGSIGLTVGDGVGFEGGGGSFAYARIGHGGAKCDGDRGGDITVEGEFVEFMGGEGSGAFAQIGHGGWDDDGTKSGTIDVIASGELPNGNGDDEDVEGVSLLFEAGTGDSSYAQLGHGGQGADGDITGDIIVDAFLAVDTLEGPQPATPEDWLEVDLLDYVESFMPTIAFVGGRSNYGYALFGHGGYDVSGDIVGDLDVVSEGGVLFAAGPGSGAFAQFGHCGFWSSPNVYGDISLGVSPIHYHLLDDPEDPDPAPPMDVELGYVVFHGGDDQDYSYAQLGHGGASFSGEEVAGNIEVGAGNLLAFQGGAADGGYAQLGHGGANPQIAASSVEGDIDVYVYENAIVASPAELDEPNGDDGIFEDANVYSLGLGGVLFQGGTGTDAYAQLGHGGHGRASDLTGDVTLSFVQLPMEGPDYPVEEPTEGALDINVERLGLLILRGGGDGAYAQIGHGGTMPEPMETGTMDGAVEVVFGVEPDGNGLGDGNGVILQNGNGNPSAELSLEAALLSGGEGGSAYAQIGHGGTGRQGEMIGDVALEAAEVLVGLGGEGGGSHVQIGHGGFMTGEAPKTGDVTVALEETFYLSGTGMTVLLDGMLPEMDNGFEIEQMEDLGMSLASLGTVYFAGGSGSHSYAQVGHGGATNAGICTGNIEVTLERIPAGVGDMEHSALHVERLGVVGFAGGSGVNSYAQLGHGGTLNQGSAHGTINLLVGDEEDAADPAPGEGTEFLFVKLEATGFLGGTGIGSYAQMGHGGAGTQSVSDGDIVLLPGDILLMRAGSEEDSYVQVGHGGAGDESGWGTQSGSVDVLLNNQGALVLNDPSGGEVALQEELPLGGVWDVGGLVMLGGQNPDAYSAYAQVGHGGGEQESEPEGEAPQCQGDIDVDAANVLVVAGGANPSSYSQIGHGGAGAGSPLMGDLNTLRFDGEIMVTQEQGGTVYGLLGEMIVQFLTAEVGLDDGAGELGVAMLMGGDEGSEDGYAQIGHGGAFTEGNSEGPVTVLAEGFFGAVGGGDEAYAQVGHGGYESYGSGTGDIWLDVGGSMTVPAEAFPSEGFGPVVTDGAAAFLGGWGETSYAHLGHGGADAAGVYLGDIDLTTQGAALFQGGTGPLSYAHMGHAGPGVSVDPVGDITISQPEYLVLWGGEGPESLAVIGHGDVEGTGEYDIQGDILLDVAGSTILSFGSGFPYWIGHLGGNVIDSEIILLTSLLFTEGSGPTGTYGAVISDPAFIDMISQNLMYGDFTLGIRGGGDLLLDTPICSEGMSTLTLATEGDFVNGVGPDAFCVERWLIYSHDPDNIVKNMLTGPEQFNSPYFPPPPVAPGFQDSGFLYVVAGQRSIPQNDTYDETERPRRIVESFLAPDPMEIGFVIHYVREAAEVLGGLMGRLSSYDLFESEETE